MTSKLQKTTVVRMINWLLKILPEKRRGNCAAFIILQVFLWPAILSLLKTDGGTIYRITGVAIVITWLLFHNWDWMIKNWWFRKGNLAFKQLIPNIEDTLKMYNYINTSQFEKIDLEKDFTNSFLLLSQLNDMDIGPSYEDWLIAQSKSEEKNKVMETYFMVTLDYARNKTYKEYVEYLNKKNKNFAEKLKNNPDSELTKKLFELAREKTKL